MRYSNYCWINIARAICNDRCLHKQRRKSKCKSCLNTIYTILCQYLLMSHVEQFTNAHIYMMTMLIFPIHFLLLIHKSWVITMKTQIVPYLDSLFYKMSNKITLLMFHDYIWIVHYYVHDIYISRYGANFIWIGMLVY